MDPGAGDEGSDLSRLAGCRGLEAKGLPAEGIVKDGGIVGALLRLTALFFAFSSLGTETLACASGLFTHEESCEAAIMSPNRVSRSASFTTLRDAERFGAGAAGGAGATEGGVGTGSLVSLSDFKPDKVKRCLHHDRAVEATSVEAASDRCRDLHLV